jgi:hypothetical protein
MAANDVLNAVIVFWAHFFDLADVVQVDGLVLGKVSDDRSQGIPAEWTFHLVNNPPLV